MFCSDLILIGSVSAPLSVRSIKQVSTRENEQRWTNNYLLSLVFFFFLNIIITEEEHNKQVAFAFKHDFFFLPPCTDISLFYKTFPVLPDLFRTCCISCDEAYFKNDRILHLPHCCKLVTPLLCVCLHTRELGAKYSISPPPHPTPTVLAFFSSRYRLNKGNLIITSIIFPSR